MSNPQQQQQQQSQPQPLQASLNQQSPLAQSTQSGQATQPAFFNSLLERGKKRSLAPDAQDNGFGDLPSLQLGLDDIRKKARELGGRLPKATNQTGRDQKA
jgi:nuclear pore complex protein Nup93